MAAPLPLLIAREENVQLVTVRFPPETKIAGFVMERMELGVAVVGAMEMEVSEREPDWTLNKEVVRTLERLNLNDMRSNVTSALEETVKSGEDGVMDLTDLTADEPSSVLTVMD